MQSLPGVGLVHFCTNGLRLVWCWCPVNSIVASDIAAIVLLVLLMILLVLPVLLILQGNGTSLIESFTWASLTYTSN
jgi:hypothetical protein